MSQAFLEATGTETTTAGSVTGGAANTNTTTVDNSAPSLFLEYSWIVQCEVQTVMKLLSE